MTSYPLKERDLKASVINEHGKRALKKKLL
jgi:hypothetical protein